MKTKFYSCAFLTLLLFFAYFPATSIQQLTTHQGKGKAELNRIEGGAILVSEMGTYEIVNELMGMEACHSKDEECLARRMVADAHLDYIYTQHHKP